MSLGMLNVVIYKQVSLESDILILAPYVYTKMQATRCDVWGEFLIF